MKIIFLDFDGVIAHSRYNPSNPGGVIDEFDPRCVYKIMEIIRATQALVVVESTWIHVDTPAHIIMRLRQAEFNLNFLHPDWICNSSRDKSTAIHNWLMGRFSTIEKYVVIDDELIVGHPLVRVTNGQLSGGIKDEHVKEAIKILGTK